MANEWAGRLFGVRTMKVQPGESIGGPFGTATQLLLDPDVDDPAEITATCAAWFVYSPMQTVAPWNNFILSIFHLRPIPGADKPEAHVRVAGATHEVMMYACNPDSNPDPTRPTSWVPLTPYNLMEQVHLNSDEQAVELARECAYAIVHGVLWAEPPLSGQVEPWRSSLIKTTAHIRGEEHAP